MTQLTRITERIYLDALFFLSLFQANYRSFEKKLKVRMTRLIIRTFSIKEYTSITLYFR